MPKTIQTGSPSEKPAGFLSYAAQCGEVDVALRNETSSLPMVKYYHADIDRLFNDHVIVRCTKCMAGMQKYDYSFAI